MFNTFLYQPLYNALIFLINFCSGNLGISIIILTISVKILLTPFTIRALKSQVTLKKIQPEIDAIRKNTPDKALQGAEMMSLYKKYNINPFSGCLSLIPQMLVLIALYQVFYKGIDLKPEYLYTFIQYPEYINQIFLGFDLTQKKLIILALLSGITQFMQVYFSNPDPVKDLFKKKEKEVEKESKDKKEEFDFGAELGKSMQTQMVFILPTMIAVFSYTLPGAMALYWIVSSSITIVQEYFIRKKIGVTVI